MFELNEKVDKKNSEINHIELMKLMASGEFKLDTKIMKGSKGSGNAIITATLGGVEVFKLSCGNVKEWNNIDDLNLTIFTIMEKINAGISNYIEQYIEQIAEKRAEKRAKLQALTDACRLELANCKTPTDVRKCLRNHGFHSKHVENTPNKVDALLAAAEDEMRAFVEA